MSMALRTVDSAAASPGSAISPGKRSAAFISPDRRVIVLTLVQPAEALLTEREFIAQALRGPGDLSRTNH
jgi:hypothetical protein